ncbi:Serine/threonine-protein kinase, partial [Frankliniella fusca]
MISYYSLCGVPALKTHQLQKHKRCLQKCEVVIAASLIITVWSLARRIDQRM